VSEVRHLHASARPELLFLAPVMPALAGGGLAMRAGVTLRSLAMRFCVRVLVIPVAGDPYERPSRFARDQAEEIAVLNLRGRLDPHYELIERLAAEDEREAARLTYPRPKLCRFSTRATQYAVRDRFDFRALAAVHVMRLYLVPYAAAFLSGGDAGRPFLVLDQDDDDALTHQRIADLEERRGRVKLARWARAEAAKYRELERTALPQFDRVLVCSERDRALAGDKVSLDRVAVVPNAVARVGAVAPCRAPSRAAWIVFVGTLGYPPNVDAAHFLCETILPLVRERVLRARVALIGRGAPRDVRRLSRLPGVRFVGEVRSLETHYERASVVAVPLRAGGGTRIKILEAFAHRRPVVSTSLGAEGLDVVADRHLLIADTAGDFARACIRLMEERPLAQKITEDAAALCADRYSLDAAAHSLLQVYDGLS
jgi:glycosyltransferase involved in cell wall biosynthesis